MDVRCGRCGTEYEFDDALISERGTTVKCTNCGYQFKVFPPHAGSGAPERWVVRTSAGRELVYTSLRDLQKGISQRQVGPEDMLSRGNQPPRPLGSIAELEPFLRSVPIHAARQPSTLHGVAPPANVHAPSVNPGPSDIAPPTSSIGVGAPTSPYGAQAEARRLPSSRPAPPGTLPGPALSIPRPAATPQAPPAGTTQRIGTNLAPSRPPPSNVSASRPAASAPGAAVMQRAPSPGPDFEPPTLPRNEPPMFPPSEPEPAERVPVSPPPKPESHARPEPYSKPEAYAKPQPYSSPERFEAPAPRAMTPTPSDMRESLRSYEEIPIESRDAAGLPGRRARSRWIAAVVIVGVLLLFGLTVGRRYVARFAPPPSATPVQHASDGRVVGMIDQANRLLEEGDLEGAKELLDKATGLAEKDPAVLAALARLEAVQTDVLWLKLRLLDPVDSSLVQSTHKQLGRRVGRTREAVDRATSAAPTDQTVLRAKIDLMRMAGELADARKLVGPIGQNASLPENAYTLAALDLAEPSPVWSSVVDRLRTAAAAERDLGRARGTLIYALVRSGDVEQAKSELSKLESRSRVHPLLYELEGFVKRHVGARDAGVDSGKVATVDPSMLPVLDTRPGTPGEEDREAPGDFRNKLKAAGAALKRGELDRAEQLYNAVLAQQPGNTEALAGLGDVARHRKDPAAAEKMYDRVLKENPSYLPALIARADQKWDSGDKKGAITLYRRILEQAGPGSDYGQRAAARIAQGEGSSSSGSSPGGKSEPEPTPPAAPAPSEGKTEKKEEPHIDTTDLPELNK
jgi:predicted Zn finger-like uncharacterized protein